MSAGHTPGHRSGPWFISPLYAHTIQAQGKGTNPDNFICTLAGENFREANARLIAAAPDLLSTLRAIAECAAQARQSAKGTAVYDLNNIEDLANAAIKQAGGTA